jgi:anti-anti-sigma factor
VDLSCRLTLVGTTPCLQVGGELDLASVGVLRDALVKLVTSHPGARVAVDLDGVTVLDDTALGILLGGAARARDNSGDLVIVCSSERLLHRFERSGLSRAIDLTARISP